MPKKIHPLGLLMGLVALLIFVLLWNWFWRDDKEEKEEKKKTAQQTVRAEVNRNVHVKIRAVNFSPIVEKMIEEDPDYVLVCLGVEYAKGFPGMSEEEAERITAKAAGDSRGALQDLKKCVYDRLTQEIKEYKGTSDKNYRQGWNSNNPATALLFIYAPIAERVGKKKELVREYLGLEHGEWSGGVPGHRQDWLYGVVWPWPDETPPAYWSGRGWKPVD